MKIGIFSGTFDPVHNGHLEFAKAAVAKAALDKVIIVAEKMPYRKAKITSWDHRQAMIERASSDISQVDHDYHFAAELANQHTLKNMLGLARKQFGEETEIWFLVGSDIFEHVHVWEDIVLSESYGGFVVALRGNHTTEWVTEKSTALNLRSEQLTFIDTPKPHISSSKIRQAAENGQSVEYTPLAVKDYISRHQLYSSVSTV